jgi:hypothetical protein
MFLDPILKLISGRGGFTLFGDEAELTGRGVDVDALDR